jgi:hypothetical protein
MGLRFGPLSGWLGSSDMDLNPPEPAKPDERAQRVRTIILILMAVFIAAPVVLYFVAGSGVAPRQ